MTPLIQVAILQSSTSINDQFIKNIKAYKPVF